MYRVWENMRFKYENVCAFSTDESKLSEPPNWQWCAPWVAVLKRCCPKRGNSGLMLLDELICCPMSMLSPSSRDRANLSIRRYRPNLIREFMCPHNSNVGCRCHCCCNIYWLDIMVRESVSYCQVDRMIAMCKSVVSNPYTGRDALFCART